MLADENVSGTPAWWLLRLGKALAKNRNRYDRLDAYYRGHHPLPVGHKKARDAFKRFQKKARSNYTGLVVESVRERMHIEGFRVGGEGDVETDREAWRVWQANQLDADALIAHRRALIASVSYVIVGPPSADVIDVDTPVITIEDPSLMVHESDPVRRRTIRAALKCWRDDEEAKTLAVLYLPKEIWYFQSATDDPKQIRWNASSWDLYDDGQDGQHAPPVEKNTIGVVPVVPFINRPDEHGHGLGEFEDVLDIQDRINHSLLDRLMIASLQAYRQRWAKGVDIKGDELPFIPGVDQLWAVPDKDAQFGDFGIADIVGLLDSCKADIRDLAAITRTPPSYLLGEMVNLAGDAMQIAEIGLVSKVRDRQVEYGECWEHVNRIAGLYTGREVPEDAEVIWSDPEFRSMAERSDAALKQGSAGVPWRSRMQLLGYTQTEIERMETERAADALLGPLAEPGVRVTETVNAAGPPAAEPGAAAGAPQTAPPAPTPPPPARGG